jgi:glutaminase
MLLATEKPHNPMINAGAILVCTLLKTLVTPEMTLAEKFDFTMNYFKVSSPVFACVH